MSNAADLFEADSCIYFCRYRTRKTWTQTWWNLMMRMTDFTIRMVVNLGRGQLQSEKDGLVLLVATTFLL